MRQRRLALLPTGFVVVVSAGKNDWNFAVRGGQLTLQLQSVHAGDLYVNDQTRGIVQMARAKKVPGRLKSCLSIAKRLDEQFCRPANGLIVVNDRK